MAALKRYLKRNPSFKQKKLRALLPDQSTITLEIPKPKWMS